MAQNLFLDTPCKIRLMLPIKLYMLGNIVQDLIHGTLPLLIVVYCLCGTSLTLIQSGVLLGKCIHRKCGAT